MPATFTRIISDLHYGDRASLVSDLAQLDPLCAGVAALVCNGDSLDTRPCPRPEIPRAQKADLLGLQHALPVTFLTGNHDPDFSDLHRLDLAGGRVLVTHGDICFDDIVPWGMDAPFARRLVAEARAATRARTFEELLVAHRRAAAGIPQRHQAETHPLRYLGGFLSDTIWPPLRIPRVFRAWAEAPGRAARLAATHRPQARFVICGHTHHPGVWQRDGRVVINTGSYCRPLGRLLVDLADDHLTVRRVDRRGREFHPGAVVAEFALA